MIIDAKTRAVNHAKAAFKDLQEETQSRVRGDKNLGYDQM